MSQKIKFLLCDTWSVMSEKPQDCGCSDWLWIYKSCENWNLSIIPLKIRFLTLMAFNKLSRLLVLILICMLSSFWLLSSIMIGYLWKKLPRLRMERVLPVTLYIKSKGKYLRPETKRDEPCQASDSASDASQYLCQVAIGQLNKDRPTGRQCTMTQSLNIFDTIIYIHQEIF